MTRKKTTRVSRKKVIDTFRIVEISTSLSGVIPTAPYENLRPGFTMTVQPKRGADPNNIITHCENLLHKRFALVEARGTADLLEKQFENIRCREKGGLKYPSVTSILDWETVWKIPKYELQQYASRGKIVHWLINNYLQTGNWHDPTREQSLREDIAIVLGGSKGFHWEDCSHKMFFKQYGNIINIDKFNHIVYNDEHFYSGEIDLVGTVEGKKSIIDIKTGDYKLSQLAAYAMCESDIKQLVVLPVGPCDNKTGYYRIVINDAIKDHFDMFLRARKSFRERFGL